MNTQTSLLQNLSQWVLSTFARERFLTEQAFNVHGYTTQEKEEASEELEEEGFFVALSENGNSLNVVKLIQKVK